MSIQHYQRVISLLPSAAMIVSSSGKLLASNHVAASMLNSIESKNCSIFDALAPNTQSDTLVYLRQCASSSQPVVGSIQFNAGLQNQIYTTYGAVLEPRSGDKEAVILLRLQPRKESNVRFLILQQQIDDLNKQISRRLKAERELRNQAKRLELMNKRKNQFLTMLAHELRSPLTPISSAAQLMKLQANTPSVFDEPRRVIDRQVSHLKRLIDDMLDVSRITTGKMKIVKSNIDLVSLIDSVCCDFRPQFVDLNITCITELPAFSVCISADSDRITQVLHNLLNNALKFTPNGGTVKVSLGANENSTVLQISDTGKGFEQSDIKDLFEPFTQAEQSLQRSAGGLGLGLSLVKGIVDLHNGNVSASSDGLNRGAKICVTLPLAEGHALTEVESVTANTVKTHRILLIEDDHDAADMMKQVLELLGHEVIWSETGTEGVKKASSIKPTLIICDIGLPGLDGFAVAQLLRSSDITSAIPLVALTGYGETEFVNRAIDVGFDRHITKPASLADIQAALSMAR